MAQFILLCLIIFSAVEDFKGDVISGSSICTPEEFPCYNGACIKRLSWCDTNVDCNDGSDERFCSKGLSPGEDPNNCLVNPFFFLCLDGSCIPTIGRCDNSQDCDDHSDEKNCSVGSHVAQKVLSEIPDAAEFDISEAVEIERAQNRPLRLYRYADESVSYKDLPYINYRHQLDSARTWLKGQQRENYGWVDYTTRAVVSMYLSKEDPISKSEDDLLMDKQLDIELAVALTRNETRSISLSELALYINALLAACKNPRNFYGYDLVNILRERADSAHSERKFVSPLIYLVLCLSNATTYGDVRSLQESLRSDRNFANKVDMVSIAVLASSCIVKTPEFSHAQYRRNFVEMLLNTIQKSGLPGNIYEAALVMQALNEAKVDPREWEREDAIEFILSNQDKNGSFGDILATYYTIPILSGRSLLSMADHCGKDFSNGRIPLAILKNTKKRKITVNYSLLFGDPVEMTQKVQLRVAEGTNFLDIMRLAEEENPNFRFSLDETKQEPFVYSIGGIPNDAECGLYWKLHIQNTRNPSDLISYVKDIRDLVPRDGDEIRFWLKQM